MGKQRENEKMGPRIKNGDLETAIPKMSRAAIYFSTSYL
jgi:hypothetical protein